MDCLLHAQHHQSLLCHGSWGRYEGARSILTKSNGIRAHGHHSECCSHSPWATTWPLQWVNVLVGDVAKGMYSSTEPLHFTAWCVNSELGRFPLVLICRAVN